MDPTKPSLTAKAPHVNNGGANDSLLEETALSREAVDPDRLRDMEPDVDLTAAAELSYHHRGSEDKQKYSTMGYQRRTKEKVVTDFATLSKGSSAGGKPRAALRQVLFSQGVSDKTSEQERGQLDGLKQDLENFTVPGDLKWRWMEENQGATLESSWTDIVQSHSTMARMQRHQQEALWEFISTELIYINKLLIIKNLVIAALVYLRQRGHLLEMAPAMVFSNLPSVLFAHQLFWQEVIYPMLHEVRKTGKPFDPTRLEAGCLQFHERFSSYKHYCWEEKNNLEFSRSQMENNPHFLTFVQWVETHPQCQRMRLGEMQAKPHLRITKYPLLLKAVLKNTQDPQVQQKLRGMLSTVNNFLESINDYLRLKDEELALSISAERVEGYEVEGINEEIDKHVREICQFDLTCPIRGVGPEVIRKLLLEENLKVRGRKDSKLEVVALLFSDVLLITKVQKKGERLKVVRPPLALDRTFCFALKDGYSFVLVEVGELQSAMNVLIFVASTSDSCSTWVSTIHKAKETLNNLRQTENSRLEKLRLHKPEAKPVSEDKAEVTEPEDHIVTLPKSESFADEMTKGYIGSHSANYSRETRYQSPNEVAANNSSSSSLHSRHILHTPRLLHRRTAVKQPQSSQYEWIELKGYQGANHTTEDKSRIAETALTDDHRSKSVDNLDVFSQRFNTTRPQNLFLGGLPDVDYPTEEESTLQIHSQPATPSNGLALLALPGDPGSRLDGRRYSSSSQSEASPDIRSFARNLKSPGLRRRRPISTNQSASLQALKHSSQGSTRADASPNDYSGSNSDSEVSLDLKRNSLASGGSPNSHRVLKLSSLKPHQDKFWNMFEEDEDRHIFSESELPDLNPHHEKPKLKTQRSASNPQIVIEPGLEARLYSSSMRTSSLSSMHKSDERLSPLMGLLERAKERKRDKNVPQMRFKYPPPSPSVSTTPSPPPSNSDRDTEWEDTPPLMRSRARTVSKGWKEQLVDGDDDSLRNSMAFADGVNVDWSGWCFDDDEVMDHLQPREETLLEGINRSLNSRALKDISEHNDECSEV
ncbi:uncharacterized protein plekhg6 [Salarias fasciatus]|uniref:uncharacterized protein plekhg6 n=1 Tax=Salarias fasciatus TaxID=181472 RepID=UPI0011764D9B|nr:pleckstrin homology domain-containing family G member 6 [Salarias fasciatus]